MGADRLLTFEGDALDLANEPLLHDGDVVSLTPKAFAVLRRRVEDGGQVVSAVQSRQSQRPLARHTPIAASHPASRTNSGYFMSAIPSTTGETRCIFRP
jgi:hypothetical protein